MRASRFAAFLLLAALLGACSAGRSNAAPPPGATTGAPAASTPATTAAAPTSTTPPATTAYVPSAPQASPDAAGARLMDAWSAGNRAEADSIATPAAVTTLFAIPYPTGNLQPRGCTDGTTNPGTCTYRNTDDNGIYEVTVQQGPGGWYVSAVTSES